MNKEQKKRPYPIRITIIGFEIYGSLFVLFAILNLADIQVRFDYLGVVGALALSIPVFVLILFSSKKSVLYLFSLSTFLGDPQFGDLIGWGSDGVDGMSGGWWANRRMETLTIDDIHKFKDQGLTSDMAQQ